MGPRLTMFEVRILPGRASGWRAELRGLPGVRRVETLHSSRVEEVDRVFFEGPTYVPLLRDHGLVRRFPFPVSNGVARWTVVGPPRKVRALAAQMRRSSDTVEIEAIRPRADAPSVLTPRQREVLRRAFEEGYFEVPRKISLTRLAAKMGVAISTLSVTIAVIERKLLGDLENGRGSGFPSDRDESLASGS